MNNQSTKILHSFICTTTYVDATSFVLSQSKNGAGGYLCAANVHMLMEAWDCPVFREIVNSADIVTPDGMPLVWLLRLKGYRNQQRVYGPTLMLHVLKRAAEENIPVGFYGGIPDVLEELIERMKSQISGIERFYFFSPPFHSLSPDEDNEICVEIQKSGVRILFVGLGCPKQERWMAEHRDRIPAVMLGVGAAFDFHAGRKSQAPSWMQKAGLEWLYRFLQEPRRLWKRYLIQNPRFVALAIADLLGILKISSND